MKKRIHIRKPAVLIITVLIVVSASYFLFRPKESENIVTVAAIEGYSYVLESNQTKIYKKYFKDLQEELKNKEVDEEKYARLITQLFLIDFYTLTSKMTNQDIGGVQYIYSKNQDNFRLKASETIYKYVESNIYGNRKQELPSVKDVEIESIKEINYSLEESKKVRGYELVANISYKKDLGYDTKKTITVIEDEEKLSIAEIK